MHVCVKMVLHRCNQIIPERHCAVISHVRHSAAHCAYASDDVTLNWLPFDHVVPMLTYHLADVYLCRSAVQERRRRAAAARSRHVSVMLWSVHTPINQHSLVCTFEARTAQLPKRPTP